MEYPVSPLTMMLRTQNRLGMRGQPAQNESMEESRKNAALEDLKILMLSLNGQPGGGGGYMPGAFSGDGEGGDSGGMDLLSKAKQGKDVFSWLKKLFKGSKGPSHAPSSPYDPSAINSLDFTSTLNFTPGATGFTATGGSIAPTMALYYPPPTYKKPLSRQT